MSTITVKDSKFASYAALLLRVGLGVGFLSAVADRLGLWGAFGQPNVEWGNFSRFLEYTHTLNWYLPAGMILPLGVIATGAEISFGVLLLVGWHTRVTALLSGFLLLSFGVAMTLALGVKAPLNFAVLTGIGGALFLANCESFPFSLDELLFRRAHPEAFELHPMQSGIMGRTGKTWGEPQVWSRNEFESIGEHHGPDITSRRSSGASSPRTPTCSTHS